MENTNIIHGDDLILVTGANGFIGSKVVETLLHRGFTNLRCFVRPSGNLGALNRITSSSDSGRVEIIRGNLLSRDDCHQAAEGASVIYHLAAGVEKSFPGSYLNSVVTTRNLLDSTLQGNSLKRFVNVSSLVVYSNLKKKRGSMLDETCEIDNHPELRHEPYSYSKAKQDELVLEYVGKYHIPHVMIRPSVVFGPGKKAIPARVGIGTFGLFLHLGGPLKVPMTYVDNCADAIVLAGIRKGVDGETFNIVDDDLPTSREFLKLYKRNVGAFPSIYIPYRLFYGLCCLWELYSNWSEGQVPPVFNRRRCATYWKGNRYSNRKIKELLGWKPKISFEEGLRRYFEYQKQT